MQSIRTSNREQYDLFFKPKFVFFFLPEILKITLTCVRAVDYFWRGKQGD